MKHELVYTPEAEEDVLEIVKTTRNGSGRIQRETSIKRCGAAFCG